MSVTSITSANPASARDMKRLDLVEPYLLPVDIDADQEFTVEVWHGMSNNRPDGYVEDARASWVETLTFTMKQLVGHLAYIEARQIVPVDNRTVYIKLDDWRFYETNGWIWLEHFKLNFPELYSEVVGA